MKTLLIILAVYVLLDIIASIIIMARAKKNGINLKTMAIMLRNLWHGYTNLVDEGEADYE